MASLIAIAEIPTAVAIVVDCSTVASLRCSHGASQAELEDQWQNRWEKSEVKDSGGAEAFSTAVTFT